MSCRINSVCEQLRFPPACQWVHPPASQRRAYTVASHHRHSNSEVQHLTQQQHLHCKLELHIYTCKHSKNSFTSSGCNGDQQVWMYYRSGTGKRCCTGTRQVAALFCKKWHHGCQLQSVTSKIRLHQSMGVYLSNTPAKFQSNLIWNDMALGFLWRLLPQTNTVRS